MNKDYPHTIKLEDCITRVQIVDQVGPSLTVEKHENHFVVKRFIHNRKYIEPGSIGELGDFYYLTNSGSFKKVGEVHYAEVAKFTLEEIKEKYNLK